MATERTCTQDAITRRRTHSAAITDCMLIASLISIRGTQRHSEALTHAAASAVAERIVSVRPAEKRAVEHDSYLMREAIKMHPDALRRSQSAHVEPTLPTTQSDDIKTQSKCNQMQSDAVRVLTWSRPSLLRDRRRVASPPVRRHRAALPKPSAARIPTGSNGGR